MTLGENVPPPKEIINKETPIFAVCFNGNGRSKLIARALGSLGYEKPRAIGVKWLHQLDQDQFKELKLASVIICANTDIVSQLQAYKDGELIKGKKVVDLKMTESDHIIASRHIPDTKMSDLEKRTTKQLKDLGF